MIKVDDNMELQEIIHYLIRHYLMPVKFFLPKKKKKT